MKVVVASTNPVKLKSTESAFGKMFPDIGFEIVGKSVPSGVADQPMSEMETLMGAMNRVENVTKIVSEAEFWVGIEGGLEEKNGGMEAFAWVIIKSKNGLTGKGRTGSFFLPDKIVELIRSGKELAEADDLVFGRNNSKHANGAVEILSHDVVTRTTYYEQAMVFALIPFVNEGLY